MAIHLITVALNSVCTFKKVLSLNEENSLYALKLRVVKSSRLWAKITVYMYMILVGYPYILFLLSYPGVSKTVSSS